MKTLKLVAGILFTTISDQIFQIWGNKKMKFLFSLNLTISAKFTKKLTLCLEAWPVVIGVDAQKSITSGVARSFCSYPYLFFLAENLRKCNMAKLANLNIVRKSFEHHPETHLPNHSRMSQQITWTWMLCRVAQKKNVKKSPQVLRLWLPLGVAIFWEQGKLHACFCCLSLQVYPRWPWKIHLECPHQLFDDHRVWTCTCPCTPSKKRNVGKNYSIVKFHVTVN